MYFCDILYALFSCDVPNIAYDLDIAFFAFSEYTCICTKFDYRSLSPFKIFSILGQCCSSFGNSLKETNYKLYVLTFPLSI